MQNYLAQALAMITTAEIENEQRIQECIDLYWEARKYPRKKKKAIRKQAIKDYRFWLALKEYQNQIF